MVTLVYAVVFILFILQNNKLSESMIVGTACVVFLLLPCLCIARRKVSFLCSSCCTVNVRFFLLYIVSYVCVISTNQHADFHENISASHIIDQVCVSCLNMLLQLQYVVTFKILVASVAFKLDFSLFFFVPLRQLETLTFRFITATRKA